MFELLSYQRVFLYIFYISILTLTDFYTKFYVKGILKYYPFYIKEINEYFSLVHYWNYGISFGFFSEYHHDSNLIFEATNFAICMYLLFLLSKSKSTMSQIGYLFIIGGALGNLIDRFINGAVFDFLSFNINDLYFPIFNLADTFISIGTVVLVYSELKIYNKLKQVNK